MPSSAIVELMSSTYFPRYIDAELDKILSTLPAAVIDGPRAVGKTESASRKANTVLALDYPATRELLRSDPRLLSTFDTPVLIDEWEVLPELWDVTRREVDKDFSPGRFIITGSAFPKPGTRTHTGAGRFVHTRLRPMSLAERQCADPIISLDDLLFSPPDVLRGSTTMTTKDYVEQICRSGFPQTVNLPLDGALMLLDSYISDLIESDLNGTGHVVQSPAHVESWLRSYAASTGTDATYEELLDRATSDQKNKPARNTVNRYRDLLERIWVLDPLAPWSFPGAIAQRQKARSVHHLCDPALAARLLKLAPDDLLKPKNGSITGLLFESLATLCVRSYAEVKRWHVGHYRQRDGRREIDLVVQADSHHVVGVEVKFAATVTDDDCKHLLWFREQLGEDCSAVVVLYTGEYAYRRADGVYVIPLALLK